MIGTPLIGDSSQIGMRLDQSHLLEMLKCHGLLGKLCARSIKGRLSLLIHTDLILHEVLLMHDLVPLSAHVWRGGFPPMRLWTGESPPAVVTVFGTLLTSRSSFPLIYPY